MILQLAVYFCCTSEFTDSTNHGLPSTIVCIYWKESAYKWTCAFQTHVVQISAILLLYWGLALSLNWGQLSCTKYFKAKYSQVSLTVLIITVSRPHFSLPLCLPSSRLGILTWGVQNFWVITGSQEIHKPLEHTCVIFWILYHWAAREALISHLLVRSYYLLPCIVFIFFWIICHTFGE